MATFRAAVGIQPVLRRVLPKLMRHAGLSLIGLLVLISPSLLCAQATPTNPQAGPPVASPGQNKEPKGTSVRSGEPGGKAEVPLAVKPAASTAPAPSEEQEPSAP